MGGQAALGGGRTRAGMQQPRMPGLGPHPPSVLLSPPSGSATTSGWPGCGPSCMRSQAGTKERPASACSMLPKMECSWGSGGWVGQQRVGGSGASEQEQRHCGALPQQSAPQLTTGGMTTEGPPPPLGGAAPAADDLAAAAAAARPGLLGSKSTAAGLSCRGEEGPSPDSRLSGRAGMVACCRSARW